MPRPSRFILVELLRLLRSTSTQHQEFTFDELVAALRESYREPVFELEKLRFVLALRNYRVLLLESMYELEELGILQHLPGSRYEDGADRWGVGERWNAGEPPDRDGGGGGDGDGPQQPGGDDGDETGGLSEVLGHPTLFSLAAEDFDALLDAMF